MIASAAQIANWAYQAGFTGSDLTMAIAVAYAESSGNTNATHRNSNGSTDYGLWQINTANSGALQLGNWADGATNAKMARMVWNQQGWAAWVTHDTGAYRLYMPQATIAAAGYQGLSGFISDAGGTSKRGGYVINGVTMYDPIWLAYLNADGTPHSLGIDIHSHGVNAFPGDKTKVKVPDGSYIIWHPNDDLSAIATAGHFAKLDANGQGTQQLSRVDFNAQSKVIDYAGPDNVIISGDGTQQTGAGAVELPMLGLPDAAKTLVNGIPAALETIGYIAGGALLVVLAGIMLAKGK